MEDQSIKEILIEKNLKFRKLFLEHQDYDQRLRQLAELRYKSDHEIVLEQDLKKKKLKLKDAMQRYIIEYRNQVDS